MMNVPRSEEKALEMVVLFKCKYDSRGGGQQLGFGGRFPQRPEARRWEKLQTPPQMKRMDMGIDY